MPLVVSTKKDESFEYVPVLFRGDEEPFTVKIKRIDARSFAKLEDGLTKINQEDSTISFASGSFNWNVVKRGVLGWSNVTDENGALLKFKKDANGFMDDSSIEVLPLDIISEIATTIASITRTPEHTALFLGQSEVTSDSDS
jgi:hypothetical protein